MREAEPVQFVFPPPQQASVAVAGRRERFPVRRVFCVGRNYAAHAREMGRDPEREAPFFFTKPADAVTDTGAHVPYPPETRNLHREVELVVGIGRGGRRVPGTGARRSTIPPPALPCTPWRRRAIRSAGASGSPSTARSAGRRPGRFLDEVVPEPPSLPACPAARARVRAIAQEVALDILPFNNLCVLAELGRRFGADDDAAAAWFRHFVALTFGPLEQRLAHEAETARFCHGDTVTLADPCLAAQVVNNARFGIDMSAYPTIMAMHERCMALDAFRAAAPARQPDAEG